MHYSGSKQSIAQVILSYVRRNIGDRTYVEPFLGGANVMSEFAHEGIRIGNDYNGYLIALWKALQGGWVPPERVTKEEYNRVKMNKSIVEPHLVGYMGTVCSFQGYWFTGYAGFSKHVLSATGRVQIQDRQQVQKRNVLEQVAGMRGVTLSSLDYKLMDIKDHSLVYCDPPYQGVAYNYMPSSFSHGQFWSWCRLLISKGVIVFVTERTAPEDFVSIWTKPRHPRAGTIRESFYSDHIFVHSSQVEMLDTSPPEMPKMRIPGI